MRIVSRLFLTLFLAFLSMASLAQIVKNRIDVGLNLAALTERTLDLKLELNYAPHVTWQLGTGFMHNNTRAGSLKKVSDGSYNRKNSGAFLSFGGRYNTRKAINSTAFFAGAKVMPGYFMQEGSYAFDAPGVIVENKRLEKNGFFVALGFETGVTCRLTEKLFVDAGIQYSPQLYCDQQVSRLFSVLPGVGALANLQGILTLKHAISQQVMYEPHRSID